MSGGQVVAAYHDLYQVERSFRMAKSDLAARPMFHRLQESIQAHLTIVFAALAVSRETQARTGLSIRRSCRPCAPSSQRRSPWAVNRSAPRHASPKTPERSSTASWVVTKRCNSGQTTAFTQQSLKAVPNQVLNWKWAALVRRRAKVDVRAPMHDLWRR